jgi:hypothetical protein
MLRVFHRARAAGGAEFDADLNHLQSRDVDLSIRLGAVLACDALLIGAGIQPLSASPGAPLSLDAATQPVETVISAVAVALFALSAWLAVRAITRGEEFGGEGLGEDADPDALRQRIFAAYCASIDAQRLLLVHSIRALIAGGVIGGGVMLWILAGRLA